MPLLPVKEDGMRALLSGLGLLMLGVVSASALHFPSANCEELWWERNNVYKQRGYCFKTARAIQAFGNAGCQYDAIEAVPLSKMDHDLVAEIQMWERRNRCPR